MDIQEITANQYVNIINKEANPEIKHKQISYYKVADKFCVHYDTGVGCLISPFVGSKKELKEAEAKLEETYEQLKKQFADGPAGHYNRILNGPF